MRTEQRQREGAEQMTLEVATEIEHHQSQGVNRSCEVPKEVVASYEPME